jgi:hypothetical protein
VKGWFEKQPRREPLTARHNVQIVRPNFSRKGKSSVTHPTLARLLELKTMPYREYLQTPEWQKRRFSMLRWSRRKCEECHGKNKLQVHHKTYERRGHELSSDLMVLCKDCHETLHLREEIARVGVNQTLS